MDKESVDKFKALDDLESMKSFKELVISCHFFFEGLLKDVENEFHHKLTSQEREVYLLMFLSIFLEGKKRLTESLESDGIEERKSNK